MDVTTIRTDTESLRALIESAEPGPWGIFWPGPVDGGLRNEANAEALLLGAAMLLGERDSLLALVAELTAGMQAIAPFIKVKYGMDEAAVDRFERALSRVES